MKKYFPTVFYLAVFGFIIFIVFRWFSMERDMEKGELLKDVLILNSDYYYRVGGTIFGCKINVNGKEIRITGYSYINFYYARYLVNHSFPAMYSERYNRIKLLLLPEDFAKYGLPYPDSLRWVDSLNKLGRR